MEVFVENFLTKFYIHGIVNVLLINIEVQSPLNSVNLTRSETVFENNSNWNLWEIKSIRVR